MLTLLVALSLAERWQPFSTFCEVRDDSVRESSGLAASRLYANQYYTHNDSGDSARFFRVNQQGQIEATWSLKGAKALDWEDMASARIAGKNWLFLADVGDNAEKRATVTVYRVEEPKGTGGEIRRFDAFELTFPDGAHNCEAVFVDPNSGDLYLVTKSESTAGVYRVTQPKASGKFVPEKLGMIKPDTGLGKYGRLVTAADASPDGKWVVVRTYSGILEYPVSGEFADWWKSTPVSVKPALEAQGEAVCYSLDGGSLLTSTEGLPCRISITNRNK